MSNLATPQKVIAVTARDYLYSGEEARRRPRKERQRRKSIFEINIGCLIQLSPPRTAELLIDEPLRENHRALSLVESPSTDNELLFGLKKKRPLRTLR